MKKIAILRYSALGDIITILNFTNEMKRENHVTLFSSTKTHKILKNFIALNQLVDFDDMANYKKENFDLTIQPKAYSIPKNQTKFEPEKHIIQSYAEQLGVKFSFDLFNIKLQILPKSINFSKNYMTIQNNSDWSIYKKWWGWQELVNLIKKERPKTKIYQIGGPNDPKIENIDYNFCGSSFEENLVVQSHANIHLGLDSVFNHTSNINWIGKGKTKSIILFGSTDCKSIGYPHNINVSSNLPCQPCFKIVNETNVKSITSLNLCDNPPNQTYENPQHACMKGITPQMVYKKIYYNEKLYF